MPGLFEQFPHTNLHELNLDWIIDLLNKFKEELENSAVLSVNGETGHVTLYESENVILPPLPDGVDQWRLVRLMNGQYAGILFYNGNAYIQHGNETMRLLTQKDIPSSSGVVSWNGLTGVVNVTGADIPVDDTADADSIDQAITTEHTERVNADNAIQNQLTAMSNAINSATDANSLITNKHASIMSAEAHYNCRTAELRIISKDAVEFGSLADSTVLCNLGPGIQPFGERAYPLFAYATGTPINGCVWLSGDGTVTYYGDTINNLKYIFAVTYIRKLPT